MRNKNLYLTLTLASTIALSSCKKLGELTADNFTVVPSPMETVSGTVPVTINGRFPEKYMKKKAVVTVTPVIRYNGGQAVGQSETFQGEKVEGNAQTINYKVGGNYTMKNNFDYVDDMAKSELYLTFEAKVGKRSVTVPDVKIADGVIATSELLGRTLASTGGSIAPDAYQRIIKQQKDAQIKFLIQQANIRNSELKSTSVQDFIQTLRDIKADQKGLALENIEISAYASPDGGVKLNTGLAANREKNTNKYVKDQLAKEEIEANVDSKYTAQDWEGFQELVQASNIQDKDLVLRVLSMHSDPEVREREIKNIASAFTAIADQILPKLRRSLFVVNAEKIGYSDEELIDLAKSNPSQLNVEELLYAATLFEGNEDKVGVYQACKSQFPNDWRGFNDAGMVLFQMGRVDEAKADFEKANSLSANNPVVQNNLGAVALKNGDLEQAEVYFGAATGAGDEVNYNKGIIAIKKGDYTTAVNYFGQCTCVNAALANILAGNNNEALNKLNSGEQIPMAYYLKAVIGARTNDDNMVMENLRKACEGDASLKAMAATDMEFAKYFENNDFVTITK